MKYRYKRWTLIAIFLAAISCDASSQTACDFSEDLPNDATTVPFDLTSWCDVDGHRFHFEKTPLAEIIRILGGHLDRTGNSGAANFDYFVNYRDDSHLITFSSNNDMGGDDHALQGLSIRKLVASDHADRLPRIVLPIRFPFGSSNISFSALTQKLGNAIGHHGVYAYHYETRYRMHDDAGRSWMADTYAFFEVRVRQGAIIALDASHSSESE